MTDADPERLRSHEPMSVDERFIAFVELRSEVPESGTPDELRHGEYDLYAPDSLVPVNGVEFEVFAIVDPGYPTGTSNPGYKITLKDGATERYAMTYRNGEFLEDDLVGGGDYLPDILEPLVAKNLLDALERIKTEGRLTPR